MAGEMSVRIGQKIRRRRMEMGLNQREFADRIAAQLHGTAPVDGQRVSDWERGINKPSERYLTAIAEVTDRDIGWFYENDDTKTPDLFASDAQVSEGFVEFRGHVQEILNRLDRLESERERVGGLLDRQSAILERIEAAIRLLPEVQRLEQIEAEEAGSPPAELPAPEDGEDRRAGEDRRGHTG